MQRGVGVMGIMVQIIFARVCAIDSTTVGVILLNVRIVIVPVACHRYVVVVRVVGVRVIQLEGLQTTTVCRAGLK